MAYIGASPTNGVRRKHTYTATASQTTFSGAGAEGAVLSYRDSNYVDVYVNGVKLGDADYTATSGTSIVLDVGAAVNDIVEIIAYDVFSVADTVSKADGGQFDGNVTMAGTLDVTGNLTISGTSNFQNDITLTGASIAIPDNEAVRFGAGQDLSIFHDAVGGGSYINESGSGNLIITGTNIEFKNTGSTSTLATLVNGGAVNLYHNGSKKFETASTGVTISDQDLSLTGDSSGGETNLVFTADSNTTKARIQGSKAGASGGRLIFSTNNSSGTLTEAMRIDSSGNVGIGTSSPDVLLELSSNNPRIKLTDADNTIDQTGLVSNISAEDSAGTQTWVMGRESGSTALKISNKQSSSTIFETNATEAMRIDSSGRVGIGTSSPAHKVHIADATTPELIVEDTTNNVKAVIGADNSVGRIGTDTNHDVTFRTNDTERMRIDSSGNVGIGISSPSTKLHVSNNAAPADNLTLLTLQNGNGTSDISTPDTFIDFVFKDSNSNVTPQARIAGHAGDGGDANAVNLEGRGYLTFHTSNTNNTSGVEDPPERMRIRSDGAVLVGQSSTVSPGDGNNTVGISLRGDAGRLYVSGTSDSTFNRTSDGEIIQFRSAGNKEGYIAVSGTTVSYAGGHLSRWSQLADNTRDNTIVKGTVMTNLDQMAEWTTDGVTEDNEQLNCMAVSSVEGDANVAGVFVNWDDDDDVYTADMNIAMTGDMVIRIAQGTTVARGDLLMSAGDGTAKPQGDDIVRSKTIAKVTSTNVSHTYDDGTYLVPCVLMAC